MAVQNTNGRNANGQLGWERERRETAFRAPQPEKLSTRVIRGWVMLVAVLVLSGCTVARFGYEMLPWYASWQLDRHLSLDSAQRSLASERIDAIHAWHRQTQMPRYAALVENGIRRLDGPIAAADIAAWRAQMFALWQEPAERIAPDLADLALTLRPAQIDRLERRLADSTAELRRKYLEGAPAERLEGRIERWQERMQWLLGDITAAQKTELRRLASEQPSDEAAWLEERQSRNERLVRLLRRIEREKPSREQALAWSTAFLQGFWQSEDPARARRIEANAANGDRVAAAMINTASRSQRDTMRAKLSDIERDVMRMISRGARP